MKFSFLIFLLSSFNLFSSASSSGAAAAGYIAPAEVKRSRASQSAADHGVDEIDLEHIGFDTDSPDSKVAASEIWAAHTTMVANLESALARGEIVATLGMLNTPMDDNTRQVFELISGIARQHPVEDPLAILDTAVKELKEHARYKAFDFSIVERARNYFKDHPQKLCFLEKLLLHEWYYSLLKCQDESSRNHAKFIRHSAGALYQATFSTIERLQYNSYLKMSPAIRELVNATFANNIEDLKTTLFPRELWNIIFAFGMPAWGWSLDEAYTFYQAQNPNAAPHKLELAGYGINWLKGTKLRDQNFYRINLSDNLIAELPENAIPCSTSVMYLNDNPLQAITQGAFRNQQNLEQLLLCGGEVQSLPAGTFEGLTFLRMLDISKLVMHVRHSKIFTDLYCIKNIVDPRHIPRMDGGYWLPFLCDHDHYGYYVGPSHTCNEIDLNRARCILANGAASRFLESPEFRQLHKRAHQLLDAVERTEHAYRLKALFNHNPHYDSLQFKNYRQAQANRNKHLPMIVQRMRLTSQPGYRESRRNNELEEPLLPSNDDQGDCCVVS